MNRVISSLISDASLSFPWRHVSNAERRTAWESAYHDIPAECYDLREFEPNTFGWKWLKKAQEKGE